MTLPKLSSKKIVVSVLLALVSLLPSPSLPLRGARSYVMNCPTERPPWLETDVYGPTGSSNPRAGVGLEEDPSLVTLALADTLTACR